MGEIQLSDNEAQVYLSAALDQEACKATLTAALKSRVSSLEVRGLSDVRIVRCLQALCDDPYQMHDDVIEDVIEWVRISAIQ